MKFSTWLDTLISEKGIDPEERFELEGPSGLNNIPIGCILDAMKSAPAAEQKALKGKLVGIDFVNGDVRHFLRHLARALVK